MLQVHITSFSYKRGLPVSNQTHGGGFVFDCRCIENPGRKAEYKEKTGLDGSVQGFLNDRPETEAFFSHCAALVQSAVERYKGRGFSSLEIAFGCTGGQHRSVYFAERIWALLKSQEGISARTFHRELFRLGWWCGESSTEFACKKALIFAAGYGSRLGEITKDIPKPLVPAGGKPLIEHVINRLKTVGVSEVCVNLFYLGEEIKSALSSITEPKITYSQEEKLLGTGGGLKRVEEFFRDESYFIVHNADVYSDLLLQKLIEVHVRENNLVTLAMIQRPTSRPLLFDNEGLLCGWENTKTGESEVFGSTAEPIALGFSGIQVISSRLFDYLRDEEGVFDTIRVFLKAARKGERIKSYRMDDHYWIDVGTPERLRELEGLFDSKKIN